MISTYLDNNATTIPDEKVASYVVSSLRGNFANPSSKHSAGRQVRALLENARSDVAEMICAHSSSEIIFTSGGTESIFTAFECAANRFLGKKWQIVTSAVEHIAVFEACKKFAGRVHSIETVGVDQNGNLDLNRFEDALKKRPILSFVSLMYANNETGVLFPIEKVTEIAKSYGAVIHIDAVQATGKLPLTVGNCDYMSLSAHKFHGLKGTGALYISQNSSVTPLIRGHQEAGRRGGTENVPGIVGMGQAACLVNNSLIEDVEKMRELRDMLEHEILSRVPGSRVNGEAENRLCNTSNIMFPGKDAAMLVEMLSDQGIYVSAGAACTTGGEPSHVLLAMGLGRDGAGASIRFSVSKFTTKQEIIHTVDVVADTISSCLNTYEYH